MGNLLTLLRWFSGELDRTSKLADELAESRNESRQKTAFLNALSHDLRTPLNGLLLQAEVAKLGLQAGEPETTREAVAMMESSARATAELLDSLLQCARLDWAGEPNNPSDFLLRDAIAAGLAAIKAPSAEKSLSLDCDCPPDLRVRTDRIKLDRILSNLLVNAVKFTDAGSIAAKVDCIGSTVTIHIIDTGIGLSAEQQEHLFDEFYQVHNYDNDGNKGFGLGLPIARRLAHHLGGEIAVTSALGQGSRFSLTLPGVAIPSETDTRSATRLSPARPLAAAPGRPGNL